jgi:hypothetical protein
MALSKVRLFGLTIASEVPLPGLLPAARDAVVDVTIRRGSLGAEADLIIEEAGSFAVRDGREMVVDALHGAPERNVRLYLLGSAMGLLLHQRGLFPLHANAFAVGELAIAVAGPSGAGKSTLAAWLHRRGLPLVGDDVVALRHHEDAFVALPGVPRLRLWREALDVFGLDSEGLEQSYLEVDYDKWDLPVAADALAREGLPLGAVYVMEDGSEITIQRLGGAAAVGALFDHTYRGIYVERVGGAAAHWRAVTAIAAAIPVYRLQRPRDLSRLDALGEAVLAHARAGAVRTSAEAR